MEIILDFEKLNSDDIKAKYAFTKELTQLSSTLPEKLYPYFSEFIRLLDNPNNVIKWLAIDVLGRFSAVDSENKIDDSVLQKLFDLFYNEKMITCNHAIYALGLVAEGKPGYKEKIIQKLLKVQDNDFETDECEAIATGKVLDALTPFFEELKENKSYIDFVKFATKSQRSSTRKKAEELLKKIEK